MVCITFAMTTRTLGLGSLVLLLWLLFLKNVQQIIAAVLSENMREGVVNLYDQCAWYGLSFLIDTTLGLFLAILCLKALDSLAHTYGWTHLKESGVYVGPDG